MKGSRDSIAAAQSNPFSVLLKQRRLPVGHLSDPGSIYSASGGGDGDSIDKHHTPRALAGTQIGLLANKPFEKTFSKKRWRQRPKLPTNSLEDLVALAQKGGDAFNVP